MGNIQMIHATIHGTIAEDAGYRAARRGHDHSRQAQAVFELETKRSGVTQIVMCQIRGSIATALEPHLVAGKRVVVSGSLRLPTTPEQATWLNVDRCELVGGTRTYADQDQDNEEIER